MEISTMQAVQQIWERHLVAQVEARRVLSAGLAGPGRRTGRSVFYDQDAVARLLDRPRCSDTVLDEVKPVILRLGRDRRISVEQPWEEKAAVVAPGWYLPLFVRLALPRRPGAQPTSWPVVATIASWAVFGGEISAFEYDPHRAPLPKNRSAPTATFALTRPGAWFDRIRDTWLPLEHGPSNVTLWGAPVTTDIGADPISSDYDDQIERLHAEKERRSVPKARAVIQETSRPAVTPPAPPAEQPDPPRPPSR